MNQLDLAGKVAFVTGASGGLGAHFAATLAAAGAEVIIGARRPDAMAQIAGVILAAGGSCGRSRSMSPTPTASPHSDRSCLRWTFW
jgi:NAD(P)-dependent dehydrogenase (short-subunit alcohol dehydrogenase family)